MGTLKQRIDKLIEEAKRRNEVVHAQGKLIVRLQHEIGHLEAINKRLEAENQYLENKIRVMERGPK